MERKIEKMEMSIISSLLVFGIIFSSGGFVSLITGNSSGPVTLNTSNSNTSNFATQAAEYFTGTTELYYDDGSWNYAFRNAPGGIGAVKFSTSDYTQVLKLKYYVVGQSLDLHVYVLDADLNILLFKRVTPYSGWFEVDIEGDSVFVKGDFYVMVQWIPEYQNEDYYYGPFIGVDIDPPHHQESYLGSVDSLIPALENEDFLIRAVVRSDFIPGQLAEKYKPYLHIFKLLTYEDIFQPVHVDALVDNDYGWTLYETEGLGNTNPMDDEKEIVTSDFTLEELSMYQSDNYYASLFPLRDYIFDIYMLPTPGIPTYVPVVPPDILLKLIALNQKYRSEEPKVYVRFDYNEYGGKEYFVIQYWLFYVFNDFTNPHEGDWEMVELLFDKADIYQSGVEANPLYVAASQHDGGELRRYHASVNDDLPFVSRVGDHPLIYVARGSHASYFEEGVYELVFPSFVQWLGPVILALKAAGIAIPTPVSLLLLFFQAADYILLCDYAHSQGEPYIPELTFIQESKDDWLDFGGRWGFVNNDPIYNNGIYNIDAPQGPQYQGRKWDNPARWAFTVTSRAHKKFGASHILHLLCPADMVITNEEGQHLGFMNGQFVGEIPHSYVNSLSGEEIYVVPVNGDYDVLIRGIGPGDFSFVTKTEIPGSTSMLYAFLDVPADEGMLAYLRIGDGLMDKTMEIDSDGDGTIDQTIQPTEGLFMFLKCTGPCLRSQPGKEITIEFTIKNGGSNGDTFYLNAFTPEGWGYDLSQDSIYLNSGESCTLALKVYIPSTAKSGKYPIEIGAKSQNIAGLNVQVESTVTLTDVQEETEEEIMQNLMQPLAYYRLLEAESLKEKFDLLLQEAINKGLDVSEILLLAEKADESLVNAKTLYYSGNYIAANNVALQAISMYHQVIQILDELLDS
ncbi:MAG: hypothetical protein HXS54_11720 [Theionarchaea archaeon]|nr:hypothetical protein [Theionarchaea archaeon]